MSDNWLQFVPSDPTFEPSADAAEAARTLLASFVPRADEVKAEFKPRVEFFHPGANWCGVRCPACGADVEVWWNEAMSAAFENAFSDLTVSTPCCKATTSLNKLSYVWPAAFGKFVLEAMNPGVKDLTPNQERQLAQRLGSDLRKVWVHL